MGWDALVSTKRCSMGGSGSGRRVRGATVSTGPINDISIDVRRPRSGEDAREVRDRRLNTHRDRIEPCWRFWLGGHFAQLRARLARLASVDTTSDGKNRWCGRGCCSCSSRSSGPRANRIPAKISNFRLFARTKITRIRFFQTVHLCSSVFKNRLADCFTPKPPKRSGVSCQRELTFSFTVAQQESYGFSVRIWFFFPEPIPQLVIGHPSRFCRRVPKDLYFDDQHRFG